MIFPMLMLLGLVIVTLMMLSAALKQRSKRIRCGVYALALNLLGCMLWEYSIVGFVWNEGMKFYRGFGAFGLAVFLFFAVLASFITAYNAARHDGEGRFSRLVLGFRCKSNAPGAALGMITAAAAIAAANPVMLFIAENARGKQEHDWLYGLFAAAVVLIAQLLISAGISAFMANTVKSRAKDGDVNEAAAPVR